MNIYPMEHYNKLSCRKRGPRGRFPRGNEMKHVSPYRTAWKRVSSRTDHVSPKKQWFFNYLFSNLFFNFLDVCLKL